jgi:hypothetical protein
MLHARIFAFSAALGVAAIMLLGALASQDEPLRAGRAAGVSAAYRTWTLTGDNLADAIGSIPLHHRLTRVDWDDAILSADLLVREGARAPDSIWEDAAALIRFSFEEADNVRRLLIRVYGESGTRKELLFYGDPARDEWPAARLKRLRPYPGAERPSLSASQLSLESTPAGERWLRNFAN